MAAQLKSYSETNGRAHNELLHDRHFIQPIMLGLGGISGDIDKSVMATQEKVNMSAKHWGGVNLWIAVIFLKKKNTPNLYSNILTQR